jgi:NAD(P)-dependent dehydrogenase (short-subunit alcohol dehydrogenase family)
MEKKIILITGASSGMGKYTLGELAKDGHIVYGTYRDEKEAEVITGLGGIPIHMEMTEEATLEAGVKKVIDEQGHVDVLWNNAGFGLYGPMEEIPMDKARFQFEVNLFGLARLTQFVLPHMRKENKGLIINTSSMGGKIYFPLGAWYHASKHALEGWSDCMRLDLKEFNIDVVVLEPGLIDTGFASGVQNHFPEGSDTGPYKNLVGKMMNDDAMESMKGSNPRVISDTIKKIIAARNPKPRYLVGKMAKPLVWTRKLFGDRIYDRVIMSQFK